MCIKQLKNNQNTTEMSFYNIQNKWKRVIHVISTKHIFSINTVIRGAMTLASRMETYLELVVSSREIRKLLRDVFLQ